MARGQRNWSEATKAAVIAACEAGMMLTEVAKTYGVPHPTVCRWLQIDYSLLRPKVDAERKSLDQKSEEVAHMLVDAIPGKIPDAPLIQTATSFGIAIDKMRLLREQSTANVADVTSSEDKLKLVQDALAKQGLPALKLVGGGKTGTDG